MEQEKGSYQKDFVELCQEEFGPVLRMHNLEINGERKWRQLANPGSLGKMAIKMVYVCVCVYHTIAHLVLCENF